MSVYTFLSQGSLPLGNFFAGSVMQSFGGWAGYPSCGPRGGAAALPLPAQKERNAAQLVRPGRRAEGLSFAKAAQNGGAARSAYKKPPLSRKIAERRLAS